MPFAPATDRMNAAARGGALSLPIAAPIPAGRKP